MVFHERNDGDIVKILPLIGKDNKVYWYESYDLISINCSNKNIAIIDNTGFLGRMINRYNYENPLDRVNVYKRYYSHCYSNGESKVLTIGRSMLDIIHNALDIRSNKHLLIRKEIVHAFPSFDKSTVIDHDWTPPVSNINSEIEWLEWLKNNQPDIRGHFSSGSIENNIPKIVERFGSNLVSELIQKERDEKLEKLLN